MKKMIASLLLLTSSASVYATDDPVSFVKKMPYNKLLKTLFFLAAWHKLQMIKASFLWMQPVAVAHYWNGCLSILKMAMTKLMLLLINIKVQPMPFILRENPM